MIPGKWADYDVPDETQIVGQFNYYQPIGSYWVDSDATGSVAWGWLDTPQVGLQAVEPTSGCQLLDLDTPAESLDFIDIGVTEARMRSPLGTIELPFDAGQNRFVQDSLTEDDVAAGATWTLDNLESDEGTFFVSKFVVIPPRFEFAGFELDGAVPDLVDREDYTITWEPESGAESVLVDVYLIRGSDVIEVATCYADARDRTLTIPVDLWTRLDDANEMQVHLGSGHETASKIEGVYGASRMAGVWYQVGAARF